MSKTVKDTSMITEVIKKLRTLDDAIHHFTWTWNYTSEFDEESRIVEFTRYGIRRYILSYNEDRTLSQIECVMQYPSWSDETESWENCANQPFDARLTSHEVYVYPTAAEEREELEHKEVPRQELSAAVIEVMKRLYNGELFTVKDNTDLVRKIFILDNKFYEFDLFLTKGFRELSSGEFRDYIAFCLKYYYNINGEFISQDLTYSIDDYKN